MWFLVRGEVPTLGTTWWRAVVAATSIREIGYPGRWDST
jgi:hypothetical protein